MRKLCVTLMLIGCSITSFSQDRFQGIELDLKSLDLAKYKGDFQPMGRFDLEFVGDSYTIVAKSGVSDFGFEDVQMDSGSNTLKFKQFFYPEASGDGESETGSIEYEISKLNRKKFLITMTYEDETFTIKGYGLWYCTNHTPVHSCTLKELKACSKDNGCEF